VLDALLAECTARGIELRTSQRVAAIGVVDGHFRIDTSAGAVTARRLVLATGGLSLPRTGSDGRGYAMAASLGHSIVPTTPALVPLILNGDLHDGLAGVSHEVRVRVGVSNGVRIIEGPMLWTHVGVSGPAILDASRHWLRKVHEGEAASLSLQLIPDPFDAVERWLLDAARARPRATVAATLSERLPASLAARVARLQAAEDITLARLERDTRRGIVHALTDLALPVRESRGYDHAEVTAGGVSLHEVHPETLESRTCAGLYLVGEILDVDGRLGGFNFQWAWSSGRVAGEAAARSLGK
jgi:predicted Rossmann fold flavoprotein